MGYNAVARHRDRKAFEFLKARTRFDFWEGNEIQTKIEGSDGTIFIMTPQTEAISALDELQTNEAYLYLQSLLEDSRYAEQPHLLLALESSIEYGWETSSRSLANDSKRIRQTLGDSRRAKYICCSGSTDSNRSGRRHKPDNPTGTPSVNRSRKARSVVALAPCGGGWSHWPCLGL